MIHSMLLPAVLAVCVHSAQEDPTPQGPIGLPDVIKVSGIGETYDKEAAQARNAGENAKFYDGHQYSNPNGIYMKTTIDELRAINSRLGERHFGVGAVHQVCYVQLKNFGRDGVPGHYICVQKWAHQEKVYWQLYATGEWAGKNPNNSKAHDHTRGRGMIPLGQSDTFELPHCASGETGSEHVFHDTTRAGVDLCKCGQPWVGGNLTLPRTFPGHNDRDYCRISAADKHVKAMSLDELRHQHQHVQTMTSASKIKDLAQNMYKRGADKFCSDVSRELVPKMQAHYEAEIAKLKQRLQGVQPGAQVPQDEEKTSEAAPVARAPAPRQDVGDEKEEEGVPASPVGAQVEGQMSNPPAAQQGENFAPGAPGAEDNDGMPGRVLERTEPEGTD